VKRLSGKVAIITGGAQTVGLGIARAFADAGAQLVITSRDKDKLESVRPDLESRGAQVVTYAGDASLRESAHGVVDAAYKAFGRVDILVNNAQANKGRFFIEEIDDEAFDIAFGSGLKATLFHMQAAFPHLKKRGGSVINFGSKMGIVPTPGTGIYAGAKEAIRGLSRVAAKEWGAHKIRVNVLNPASLSANAARSLERDPDLAAQVKRDLTLGYFGDPVLDIGAVAVFLASDDARYLTGQTINADGGQVML
jgi:NAD(P)-dependent dehydrogenase (short-subunit alcohol dehydrogenase family)